MDDCLFPCALLSHHLLKAHSRRCNSSRSHCLAHKTHLQSDFIHRIRHKKWGGLRLCGDLFSVFWGNVFFFFSKTKLYSIYGVLFHMFLHSSDAKKKTKSCFLFGLSRNTGQTGLTLYFVLLFVVALQSSTESSWSLVYLKLKLRVYRKTGTLYVNSCSFSPTVKPWLLPQLPLIRANTLLH